jgi:hypothetical protein
MEIDPKKIDYSKMVSAQIPKSENSAKPGESKINYNPPAQDQIKDPADPSPMSQEQNVFSEDVLLDGKKLFDLSLDMFKHRLGTFLTLIIFAVISLIIMDLLISLPMSFFVGSEGVSKINIVYFFLLGIVISIITYIPSSIFGISIIEMIKDENLTVSESIKKAFAKFGRYISAMIIGNFAIFGLILIVPSIVIIQIMLSGGDFSLESETIMWSFLTGLIGFLFILPILYIVEVWIFIAILGVVIDGLSPFESFSYSYELFKGKASQIVWRMIGLSMRLFVYLVIIQIIFGIVVGIPAGIILLMAGEGSVAFNIINYLINSLELFFQLGLTSFVLIYQYHIYENLKAMKKDLAQDYKTKNQSKIKIIAGLGVLLTGMFVSVLIYYSSGIDDLYRKEISKAESLNKEDPYKNFDASGFRDIDFENAKNDNKIEKKEDNNTVSDSASVRDSKRKNDLGAIYLMIYEYKYKKGAFPISPSTSKLNENNIIAAEIRSINGEEIPLDPNDPQYYYGYTSPDGESFEISARLENPNDSGCEPEIKGICLYKIKN